MEIGRRVLSAQVLLKFYNVMLAKRLRTAAQSETLCRLWASFRVVPATADMVLRALSLQQRHQLSAWDAMVIQAAPDAGYPTRATICPAGGIGDPMKEVAGHAQGFPGACA